MFVASSLIAPTTIFHSQLKYGLYPISATAKVYIGSDDTNEPTYATCFCKVAASFYPQFYSGQQSILMSLAAPEPGIGITELCMDLFFLLDYIEDLLYYPIAASSSSSQTFVMNHKNRSGMVSPQTGTRG